MPEVGQWGPQPLLDQHGSIVRSAEVTVYETDGTTPATLYADQAGVTALANPLPIGVDTEAAGLDENGNVNFYAVPGPYELAVVRSGAEVYRSPIAVAVDTAGAGSGTVTSVNNELPDVGGNVALVAADIPATPFSTIAATDVAGQLVEIFTEGGGGAPSGPAGGVLGGTYPDPTFAVDMATQGELDAVAATIPTTEGIQDVAGGMVTGNVETGIAVTYDDTNGKLDFVAEVTQAELDLKADLASPTFTGNPQAPTPSAGDDDTSIATTAFVDGEIDTAIAALRVFENGDGTTVDASVPGFISVDIADVVPTKSIAFDGGPTLTTARFATQVALPTCTYGNGLFGVGATLTATVDGALTETGITDHVDPALGDRVLVKNQASAFQNGVYTITDLGGVSDPWQLTRIAEADEDADFELGVSCKVAEGVMYGGAEFSTQAVVTMGTTSIVWTGDRASTTPADVYFGAARDRRRFFSDFQNFATALTPSAAPGGQPIADAEGFSAVIPVASTAATVTQQSGDSGNSLGVLDLATGTATTGALNVGVSSTFAVSATPKRFSCGFRLRVPTGTDGTETFRVIAGFTNAYATPATEGIFFELAGDGGNWDCVTVLASSETRVDSGQANGVTYRDFAIYFDPITAKAYFYYQVSGVMTEVSGGGISTTIPTGTVQGLVGIDKSAGTTSRSVRLDYLAVDQPEVRTQQVMLP